MIGQLVLRNVIHRPVRTIVSVLAIAVEVTLVITVVGLTSGMMQETAKRIEGVGADIMVQPPSASAFLAFPRGSARIISCAHFRRSTRSCPYR